ncbi:MAG: C-GCAxxG-C-C family protein [Oscillospiraceae bacterium]|jgi:hypothetical protein|nr:C-GCAxxG-C-C family protein [Oscillospiraceae bacterium]
MNQLQERIETLTLNGLHCSQIMLSLAQSLSGEEEPSVIAAMGGLGGGLYRGLNCGTLTGGCCLLASYCSRGSIDEQDKYPYKQMVADLAQWFEDTFGTVNCAELVSTNPLERREKCPKLIEATYAKCLELLEAAGIDPRGD